jgi:hypothetical protein
MPELTLILSHILRAVQRNLDSRCPRIGNLLTTFGKPVTCISRLLEAAPAKNPRKTRVSALDMGWHDFR